MRRWRKMRRWAEDEQVVEDELLLYNLRKGIINRKV